MKAVLLDGKASQLNRMEEQLSRAVKDGNRAVSLVPRVVLKYEGQEPVTDLDLPHRAFDGHIRAGFIAEKPVVADARYAALRNVTEANMRPLLEVAPAALAFGAWDSSRKAHQVRLRSPLTGEIIGVLANQTSNQSPRRGGARVDALAASVQLSPKQMESLLDSQEQELSPKTVEKIRKEIKGAKGDKVLSGSPLGLGSIPPSLDALGLVSCSRILRHHVLSFARLRQLRFGAGIEGDAACRALLAAFALNGLARSNSELVLRANCDLVECEEPKMWLDARYGRRTDITPPSIEDADELLLQAIEQAKAKAGVEWQGQTLEVTGNPIVMGAAQAEAEE